MQRLTMATPQAYSPALPKPGWLRYTPQSAGTPSHVLPSDRRTHAARTVRRFAPTTDSLPGRSPFDPVRYLGQRHLRQYQHVHMVGHDDPIVPLIKLPALAGANRFHYLARDSRIAQPQRPMALGQRTILCG